MREIKNEKAVMHKSVYSRFAAGKVVLFDRMDDYRPTPVSRHVDFVQYFDPKVAAPKPADIENRQVADDIEYRWECRRQAALELAQSTAGAPVADKTSQVDRA